MVKSVVNFSHLRSDPSHPAVSSSQFLVIFCHFTKYKKINLLQKIQYLQVIYKVRQLQECTCCRCRHRCPSWGHCRTCFGVQCSTLCCHCCWGIAGVLGPSPLLSLWCMLLSWLVLDPRK